MELSQITELIIETAPAITALIGVIVALIVGIKSIKNSNNETQADVKAASKELKAIAAENKELKKELKSTLATIKKIHKNDK